MPEAIRSSETSVLTGTTGWQIPEDATLNEVISTTNRHQLHEEGHNCANILQ
jgi:hypothetical protein